MSDFMIYRKSFALGRIYRERIRNGGIAYHKAHVLSVSVCLILVALFSYCHADTVPTIILAKKVVTVFEVSITKPAGFPLDNKFTYSGPTGVVEIPVEENITPSKVDTDVSPLSKWSLRQIPADSVLSWGTNSWPGDLTSGRGKSPTATLTGYPSSNGGYGLKTLELAIVRNANVLRLKNTSIKLFYEKYTVAIPATVPNWFRYWIQTSASVGSPIYDPNATSIGYYNPGDTVFYLGPEASESNDTTGHDGIDNFAETCIHETCHKSQWWNWKSPGTNFVHSDGDWLPDSVEDPNGNGIVDPGETSPFLTDTDSDGLFDDENMCYAAMSTWNVGSADGEDWSELGHQF